MLLIMIGLAAVVAVDRLPPQHSPFAPLDLDNPEGFATSLKLAGLRDNPIACKQVVARAPLLVTEIPDRRDGEFCALEEAVSIERSSIRYSSPVRLTCPMAAALYLWEREVVIPAAIRHLGATVVRIDHAGTYAVGASMAASTGAPANTPRPTPST